MLPRDWAAIENIWVIDSEYLAPAGERPQPICMVGWNLRTGERLRLWGDALVRSDAPFNRGPRDLVVAYLASAELGCYLELGWPLPDLVLDLYVEFRNLTNGHPVPCGNSLLGACQAFGIAVMEAAEK